MNISSQEPSETNEPHKGAQERKTEADLIERAQGGDQRAFQVLVESTQQRAFAVALGYCKNREDAMDRVQEAYVKAYRNLTRFQGGSSFYTWFYRILMNACIDFSRREAKRKKDVATLYEPVPVEGIPTELQDLKVCERPFDHRQNLH